MVNVGVVLIHTERVGYCVFRAAMFLVCSVSLPARAVAMRRIVKMTTEGFVAMFVQVL